jgi:ribonuclease HI
MEISGSSKKATNNQMELQAVLEALSNSASLSYEGSIEVLSDSAYVVNGLNSWVYGWERSGWITSTKTPVENKEIWEKLLVLIKKYGKRLSIKKVKGHAGDLYNERCDEIAVAAALGKEEICFKGSQKDYGNFLVEIGTTNKKLAPKKKKKETGPAYSYVSMVDGKVHADKTWAECEKRVKGKKGAKYQKVFSKAEETSLLQDYTLKILL